MRYRTITGQINRRARVCATPPPPQPAARAAGSGTAVAAGTAASLPAAEPMKGVRHGR